MFSDSTDSRITSNDDRIIRNSINNPTFFFKGVSGVLSFNTKLILDFKDSINLFNL